MKLAKSRGIFTERMPMTCHSLWLLDLHGLGNHDCGQITTNRQLRDLGRLEPHLPVGDNPEVNSPRMERSQRLCKPHARHNRLRKARIPMLPQARNRGNGSPGESLREIPPYLFMRTVAPHI